MYCINLIDSIFLIHKKLDYVEFDPAPEAKVVTSLHTTGRWCQRTYYSTTELHTHSIYFKANVPKQPLFVDVLGDHFGPTPGFNGQFLGRV